MFIIPVLRCFHDIFLDLVTRTIKSKKTNGMSFLVHFGAESLYHEEDVIKEMEVKEATFIVQIRSKNNNFFFYFPLSFLCKSFYAVGFLLSSALLNLKLWLLHLGWCLHIP